jgi:hypothetical protein
MKIPWLVWLGVYEALAVITKEAGCMKEIRSYRYSQGSGSAAPQGHTMHLSEFASCAAEANFFKPNGP